MTTARTTYDSSTPDRATFALSARDHVTFIPAPLPRLPQSDSLSDRLQHRVTTFILRAKEIMGNNTGMLLIAAAQVCNRLFICSHNCLISCSQAFFSLMNVSVKKLNSLDPPVPAFELIFVRMVSIKPNFAAIDGELNDLQAITWICCVTYMFVSLCCAALPSLTRSDLQVCC